MKRSGIQLAVFMSCVRRRSSPVFLRSSMNSSMSRCQVSRYEQTAPLRLPPLCARPEAVMYDSSLSTLRSTTSGCGVKDETECTREKIGYAHIDVRQRQH